MRCQGRRVSELLLLLALFASYTSCLLAKPTRIGDVNIDDEPDEGPRKTSSTKDIQPQLAFVKLRPDPSRTKADVDELAAKWTGLTQLGGESFSIYAIDEDLMAVQTSTLAEVDEVKNFALKQDEAYEVECNNQKYRRDGDPPYDSLKDKPDRKQKKKARNERRSADKKLQRDLERKRRRLKGKGAGRSRAKHSRRRRQRHPEL